MRKMPLNYKTFCFFSLPTFGDIMLNSKLAMILAKLVIFASLWEFQRFCNFPYLITLLIQRLSL